MDNFNAVRIFIRVVDLGSFSKAAVDLGLGQPAVTKVVAKLEAQLGARLLHRSTHGLKTTEVGTLYYEKCRLINHHFEEAQSVASLMQAQVQGSLRVSTSVAFGRRVLVPLVMRFMKLNPKLRIELSFDDRYVDLVSQGIDVAIRMGRLADSTLGARFLGINPWVVVGSPNYLEQRGTPRNLEDLAHHAALVYSTVQGDARWLFTGVDGVVHPTNVHGSLRSNNLSALLSAVRGDMGLAALPLYVAYESIQSGAVQPVLTKWSLPSQEIHAVYPSPRLVPVKVRSFVEWLHDQIGETWWSEFS